MWERAVKNAKTNQPISTTGMFAHTYYWLTSPSGDQIYHNPDFNKEKAKTQKLQFILFMVRQINLRLFRGSSNV